ncbi:MAG: hypothetical protein HY903_06975 [Deltaproteobacteria bacterium]|nr:hypothetical protein [Deltaproteobacteria bacterium]
MAGDGAQSIRLEISQASIHDDKNLACVASWPRPAPKWGTKSVDEIDPDDLARWNTPFDRDAVEFYVTASDYDSDEVEYEVDHDRLLVCSAAKWKLLETGFAIRSLCRLGSDLFGIGADDELGVLRKGKWTSLMVEGDEAHEVKETAANVGSRIIAGARGGAVLELAAAGRKYRWSTLGKVDGDLYAVAGVEAEELYVGGVGGVHYNEAGRWRQVMRGFRGHVTALTVLASGEVLAGTSTGELWAGSAGGMKKVASDVTDKGGIGSVTRFADVVFVAGKKLLRQGQRAFEPVELPGFVPRLSRELTPRLEVVGGRLWVIGPFGLWSSADGKSFAPFAWR